jgi:hypothetical protein
LVQAGGTINYVCFRRWDDSVSPPEGRRQAGSRQSDADGGPAVPRFECGLYEIVSQVAGTGLRMPAAVFTDELSRSPAFARLLRYSELRPCSDRRRRAARHRIGPRLARWLLLSQDSVDGANFVLTHEFLSHMLGAERPSVTLAAGGLQKRGLITYRRGSVQVKDRAGLERASCECYDIVRREASRLMENGSPA